MSRLFIIGNGFDRAHGLKTGYEDFHAFLQSQYDVSDEEDVLDLDLHMHQNRDGELDCDDNVAVGFLVRLISQAEPYSEQWSALEDSLGKLDYSEVLDTVIRQYDKEGDLDDWYNVRLYEDMAESISAIIKKFPMYFMNWVRSIDIKNVKENKNFSSLIQPGDLFLTFNYTELLEKVYKVESVCHIHGKRGEKLVFGHGSDEDHYEDNMGRYAGAESGLLRIFYMLKKDTEKALRDHADFFDLVQNQEITDIYSHGFSFGEADQPYMEKLCAILQTQDITWHLNDYNKDQLPYFEDQLKRVGFQGEISTFSI